MQNEENFEKKDDEKMKVTFDIDTVKASEDGLGSDESAHRHHSHSHSHHSHGHRSSGHGRHRHHHSSKKRKKFVSFVKKHKYQIIILFLCSIIGTLLVIAAIQYNNKKEIAGGRDDEIGIVASASVKLEISIFTEDVSIVSGVVESYVESNTAKTAHDFWRDNSGKTQRLDVAQPIRFSYNVTGLPTGITVEKTVLEISKTPSFDSVMAFSKDGKSDMIDVYFLETGTHYYYRVVAKLSNGTSVNASSEFDTVNTPRMLKVDGIVNVRDIGGWKVADGKVIRQGLLYRGSELDGAVEPEFCLTEEGKTDMLSVLGIRSEMDLRLKSATPGAKDALGENVKHTYYGAPMYKAIFEDANSACIRSIFSDLADESNYPVYLHCTYGQDRTGTVCYLLEALLGMSDADLKKEYDLSAFYDGTVDLESFASFTTLLSVYEGATTQEKVENYLLSIGVTDDEIASIRRIFLGE